MKVNPRGRGRFRLAPGSAGDEFLLISMCYDDRYVQVLKLVFSLAKRLGAFPHAARYALRADRKSAFALTAARRSPARRRSTTTTLFHSKKHPFSPRTAGLYLLVDDPVSSLERRFARVETVVRRRNDAQASRASREKARPR